MRRCNYDLSRVMGMRRWLTVMNATRRLETGEVPIAGCRPRPRGAQVSRADTADVNAVRVYVGWFFRGDLDHDPSYRPD